MDYDANLIAGYPARRARIREILDLLTNAVVDDDAVGGRIAEPGMVLTIRYDASGETETFLLGRRFGEGADVTVYSTLSPLGHAIGGARPGEQRIYSLPNESGRLVTLLEAVPYEMHAAKNRGHSLPSRRTVTRRAPEATTTDSGRNEACANDFAARRGSRRRPAGGISGHHRRVNGRNQYDQRATRVDLSASGDVDGNVDVGRPQRRVF
ncbi:MAG: transcription elongation factor GreA [Mycobacterium sp.]|uniref:GreA/GreB family elongation factor n=1 Tax=Mycobacterium sp. TaxID=1785 RepID=UPI003C5488EE